MPRKKAAKRTAKAAATALTLPAASRYLLDDLRGLIESARANTAQTVNAGLVCLYWSVGERIRREVLKEKRAQYGERIVVTLSRQLRAEYGEGFGEKNLRRMIQFAEAFPDGKIVATLTRQLSWSHFAAMDGVRISAKEEGIFMY